MSITDPTDHALAAIARILDFTEPHDHSDQAMAEQEPAAHPIEADGYHKVGPGPLDVIRFKWTVRRGDDGQYYVDETIGETAAPVVSGPMSGDAALRLVDDREIEARLRYEALRNEMSGRGPGGSLARRSTARN